MAIEQMKLKAAKKAEEDAMEEEFKKQLEQKYREDKENERLYNYNRKLKEQEFKDEIKRIRTTKKRRRSKKLFNNKKKND